MYPATQTIWLEPAGVVARGLRRYSMTDSDTCQHHSALVFIDRVPATFDERGYLAAIDEIDHADSRWPTACGTCAGPFAQDDPWQMWQQEIWTDVSTGAEYVLRNAAPGAPLAPPGSCWDAWWMPKDFRGSDGIALTVRLPNGHDWQVDAQARNCTRPGQPHACWVRHGDPRECRVTVDKNGDTCAAGAGSILSGDYHGFLRNGVLTAG